MYIKSDDSTAEKMKKQSKVYNTNSQVKLSSKLLNVSLFSIDKFKLNYNNTDK